MGTALARGKRVCFNKRMPDFANAALRSFVPVAADSHFPIQNLPLGIFSTPLNSRLRWGVAIGDWILDMPALQRSGVLTPAGERPFNQQLFEQPSLNFFLSQGRPVWNALRSRVTQLLQHDEPLLRDNAALRTEALVPISQATLHLPVEIGDYTDFYSSRDHATNVGTMLRGPENALNSNWLHLPVAYHGRSSSVVASGTDIRRPQGQTKADTAALPGFGPSQALDFELEMGFFIGPGNPHGQPIPVAQAADHVFGFVLVNDWSARDLQKWEYVPLGPFLAKNFATSISPWVVPLEALSPFRVAGPQQDPQPLAYLQSTGDWSYDIQLQVALTLPASPEPQVICRSNYRHLYWNFCQQLAHHTCNGCNLRSGDLLASGTISGPTPDSRGCLLELTWGGREPLQFPGGQTRRFLQDGDGVTMTAWCQGDGYRIGFGELTGRILPAM